MGFFGRLFVVLAATAGWVVVVTRPYPAALARFAAWMKTLDRKAPAASPVSAVAKGGS